MPIDQTTPLFIDASCLVAAAGSPTGGSARLLLLCRQGYLLGAVSASVVREAGRNVAVEFSADAGVRFERLLRETPLIMAPFSADDETRAAAIVGTKDGHVLAAALAAHAAYLITLDKRLATRVNQAGLAVEALSPGDFLQMVLPTHPDYAAMRS